MPTESLAISGTPLVIDRPSSWWPGGVQGPSVLASLIGSGDGYPNFSVQTDVPRKRGQDADGSYDRGALRELFEQIAANHEVQFATWTRIHGLEVLSTRSTFRSIAGAITVRRLLLQVNGRPFILSWATRSADYPAIADVVEWCVASLRTAEQDALDPRSRQVPEVDPAADAVGTPWEEPTPVSGVVRPEVTR